MSPDIVIVGAGPAGLCLARTLSGHGLSIVVLERQAEQVLAEPAFDGREIALTHGSQALLERLGLWARLPAEEVAVLRDAQVFNGPSLFALKIRADQAGAERLGHLVANQAIRRAAYQAVSDCADVQLLCESSVRAIEQGEREVKLILHDGQLLQPRLLVAADSRFSETRRQLGIGAQLKDFGKTMLVCRMQHERDHQQVAWEWFGYGQTLALLPMNDDPATGAHRSCVVLTLPHHALEPLADMDEAAFGQDLTRRFDHRLGAMHLASTRHLYPLVGVRPHRLVAQRFACVGDAAVGMHPVTAHGFNFGLLGIGTLAGQLRAAQAAGQDIAAPDLLARYERAHRHATLPLYLATTFVARLYTTDHPPARLLRDAALRLAQNFPPFKRMVAATLSGKH